MQQMIFIAVLYKWLLPVVFFALVFKLSVWCGAEGCVSSLRAAAQQPANWTHNKNHLLHLVGILFPQTNIHMFYASIVCQNDSRMCSTAQT